MEHAKEHFLDVEVFERARTIHRVVRAMHDGECPKCHRLFQSQRTHLRSDDMVCPACGFSISHAEAEAAMREFAPVMERNLAVFEEWRAGRNTQDASAGRGNNSDAPESSLPSSS